MQAREETPAIGASPCPNRPILCYASRVEAAAGAILAGSRSGLHYARPKKFYSSHACWSQAVLAGVQPEGPVIALAPRPQIAALRHGQCVVLRTRVTRQRKRHVGVTTRKHIRARSGYAEICGSLTGSAGGHRRARTARPGNSFFLLLSHAALLPPSPRGRRGGCMSLDCRP